jgi:hypothetical protein
MLTTIIAVVIILACVITAELSVKRGWTLKLEYACYILAALALIAALYNNYILQRLP